MMVTACIVFDVTIYPLIIWFLFIDVPEFLQPGSQHLFKGERRTAQGRVTMKMLSG